MLKGTMAVAHWASSRNHRAKLLPRVFLCVFQRVQLPQRVAQRYPGYGLYLYGEGFYARETRGLKLSGAPVLFLPGNAGSYKQGEDHQPPKLWGPQTQEGTRALETEGLTLSDRRA